MRVDIRHKIISHLKACIGNAVIIFEEVQKVVPGVLEVLLPMLSERGSAREIKGSNVEYSTINCVFIFISDVAADAMIKLLLTHGDRTSLPQILLRKEIKLALDLQWQRQGLGKTINEVVPFLPLEEVHLKQILIKKLQKLSVENQFLFWSQLVVDDDVVSLLVGR